jgi:antitoxin component YwqK of YwqJK toxin-antitoxin module
MIMKKFLLLIISFYPALVNAQELPNNFKIGDFIEVFNDSVKFYFNSQGHVVHKRCAEFYRVAKVDPIDCNVIGTLRDYYINGKLQFEGTMSNNALNGTGIYYYSEGGVKETGLYENDRRKGKWYYYYPSGQTEKILDFVDSNPLVINYASLDGKYIVDNGNGTYRGEFYTDLGNSPFIISGHILNGKINGKWTLDIPDSLKTIREAIREKSGDPTISMYKPIGYETYKNGQFKYGISGNLSYKDNPKIRLQGFNSNENINIYFSSEGCLGDKNVKLVGYNGQMSLLQSFYPDFLKELSKLNDTKVIDQWILIGLNINENDSLALLNVFSSRNDIKLEDQLFSLLTKKFTQWTSMRVNEQKIPSNIFFTVIFKNNQIEIPYYTLTRK